MTILRGMEFSGPAFSLRTIIGIFFILLGSDAFAQFPLNVSVNLNEFREKYLFPGAEKTHAAESFSTSALMLQVRIFPHDNAVEMLNAPQGAETDPTQFILKAKAGTSCQVSSAWFAGDRTWKKGAFLENWNQEIAINPTVISGAKWIACEDEFVLQRSNGEAYSYLGDLVVFQEGQNPTAVLILELEDYVKCVLPSEMPMNWPQEALRAQSIAARTYAVFSTAANRARASGVRYDMDDTVYYQAYLGQKVLNVSGNAAVDSTHGMILTHTGNIVRAYFAADAGGITENAHEVWGGAPLPYTQVKNESFDPLPTSVWRKNLTKLEITQKLRTFLKKLKSNRAFAEFFLGPEADSVQELLGNQVSDIRISARTGSQRALRLNVIFEDGQVQALGGLSFRLALGLRSALFEIQDLGDGSFAFSGRGSGHGVGLSQVGAKTLAGLGWAAEEILNDYYRNIQIENLYH